jgi:catechol-2,3-dioxygenase
MPSIARLGHVGIHCNDLDKMRDFYENVLGLTETDRDDEIGMVFLSARPDDEHHEFLLCGGRTAPAGTLMLQQVSFRCNGLEDIVDYYKRFKDRQVPFDMIVTHGNAVAIYFYDPEGNRCEVYWNTGLKARQPFLEKIDLEKPLDEIRAAVKRVVDQYGETGHVDMSILAAQNIEAIK